MSNETQTNNQDIPLNPTDEINGFEKLIKSFPKESTVLDVGAGGLEGDNTSDYMLSHFGIENYRGICIRSEKVEAYKERFPDVNIIVGDFYTGSHFKEKSFDVVVLDLNIDNNVIRDWSDEGLQSVSKLIAEGGILINYVMTTHHYGDKDTSKLIRKRWKEFWGVEEEELSYEAVGKKLDTIPGFEVLAVSQERRRPYILWVALKKISGS